MKVEAFVTQDIQTKVRFPKQYRALQNKMHRDWSLHPSKIAPSLEDEMNEYQSKVCTCSPWGGVKKLLHPRR